MENKAKRFLNIEILQAFGIICVFLGHAFRIYKTDGWYYHKTVPSIFYDMFENIIYSFHMPLFVFLAGFLFYAHRDKIKNWKDYIIKRIKRLIVPFYVMGLLYVLPLICFIDPMNKQITFYYQQFLLLNQTWHLWFLPMLFLVTIFFVLHYSKFNKLNKLVLLLALISINFIKIKGIPYCIAMVPKFAIYFYLGCLCVEYKNHIENFCNKFSITMLSIFLIIMEIILYNYPKCIIYQLLCATIAIALFYIIATYTSKKMNKANIIIAFLSQNLFLLYILHEQIMVLILKSFDWGNKYIPTITGSIIFFITLTICVGIILIKNKFIKVKA